MSNLLFISCSIVPLSDQQLESQVCPSSIGCSICFASLLTFHSLPGAPCPDNIMLWNAVIFGPGLSLSFTLPKCLISTYIDSIFIAETPFEDGTFKLVLQFDETYVSQLHFNYYFWNRMLVNFIITQPNKPPSVKFVSKMFHPVSYFTA
jgi:hypothetical protein